VSIEVAPDLARDCDATVASARELHDQIAEPNLYVKVPATAEGVEAIRILVGEGRNINVTLIFGLDRYRDVMEAYISGLEAYDGDLSRITSVASFFVSRVDTEVDRRLEAIGTDAALALRGKAAVAQAQLAYERFLETFRGPRWQALADRGARVQRPLWASTSTKNPAYPDTMYVDTLVGPDSVNTMPEATLDAFEDHGSLARSVDADPAAAQRTLDAIEEAGVDLDEVSRVLEDQGVATFAKSFDELISALEAKAESGPGGSA
jgi:transaldolase